MDLPRLRRIRQGAVMSQEELAERSGVARDTISKLRRGGGGRILHHPQARRGSRGKAADANGWRRVSG